VASVKTAAFSAFATCHLELTFRILAELERCVSTYLHHRTMEENFLSLSLL